MAYINLASIYPVTSHTDFVGKGSTFVAISGLKSNGIEFIPQALQKGAIKIVVQKDSLVPDDIKKLIEDNNASLQIVENSRKALADLSAKALGNPAKKLKIIAVTGTKGKTSTCYILYNILKSLGKKVALSSTVEKRINNNFVKIALTTPLPDQLHMFLAECVVQEIEYVVMEVSAQSLTLYRVYGLEFEAAIFTNFSMEHLEFYKDMQEYFEAKKLLLSYVKDIKNFFINIDDYYGAILYNQNPQASSFSLENKNAAIYGCPHFKENEVLLHMIHEDKQYDFKVPLIGKFNVYNVLGCLGVIRALGIDLSNVANGLASLELVPGRMEQYKLKNKSRCFIDYAHNPSSFEAVLSTLRTMTDCLIAVFGAGGNRDKQKRPVMGAIAQKYCDIIILTSDNPRDEDPAAIIRDIESGFVPGEKCIIYKELNRTKAIEFSYELSKQGNIIAVLGKGRDEYQIVGDLTFPFKERSIIKPFIQDEL